MVWVTITGGVVSTATKFGGTDHGNKIANMFNGVDVSDTVTINSAVSWTFENGSFYLRNPAGTFEYLIVPAAIAADRSLTLPLITGTDTLATLGLAQTFTATQTFVAPALGTPASGVATNLTGTAASLTAGNVTTNANLTGDVTSIGNATTTVTNANLTGDVTSIGNATTTVTNANLTGDVTSIGNATTTVTNANLTGHITSTGNATVLGSFTKAQLDTAVSDGTLAETTDDLSVFAATTSLQLKTLLSDETGSGLAVFATSPTLTTPLLGTPTSGVLDNCTIAANGITYDINAQTGTAYTFVLADAGDIVTSNNAGTVIMTIPLNSSVAYPIGASLTVVSIGAGLTNFAATGGVTINSTGAVPAAPVLRIAHSSATAIKIATDTWQVVGDIS